MKERPRDTAGPLLPDLLIVAGAALAVRFLFLFQYRESPFYDFIHLDPLYYKLWAEEIAGGDWLGKEVFEQAPLYAYLLALYMKLASPALEGLRILQMLVGTATALLTCLLGRLTLGRAAGLCAGIASALYGPYLFYEGQVMKEFLTPFFSAAMLCLFYLGIRREGRARPACLAGAGLATGAAALVRDNFLLLLPLLGILLLAGRAPLLPDSFGPRLSRARWRALALLGCGAAAAILPAAARNYAVSGDLVLTTSGGGEVFYIGNGPHANGAYVPPPWVRSNPRFEHEDFREKARELTGRDLSRSEASRFWWGEGLETIAADPGRWLALEGRKALLFLNDHELPDNYSFYSFRRFSWVLNWLPTFGPMLALAVAGAFFTASRRRELLPLYLAGAGYMASVMIFFNFARFRLPFMPVLLVFSGAGAAHLIGLATRRGKGTGPAPGRLLAGVAAGLALLAISMIDLHSSAEEPFQDRLHLGAAYRQAGRLDEAEEIFRETIADAREVLARHGWKEGSSKVPGGISFSLALHAAHRDLAGVLLDQGRTGEAIREMLASIPFDPNDARLYQMLGSAYASTGDHRRALEALRRGLAVEPDSFTMRFDLATAHHELGEDAAALAELEEARRRNPDLGGLDLADWHLGMGTILLDDPARRPEAEAHLREGLRLNPDHPNAGQVRQILSLSE